MNGSYNFFFHILAVGLLFTSILGGWLLHRKLAGEKEIRLKLYIGSLGRVFALLSPIAGVLLLITGIGNIYNRQLGSELHWYSEGWLVAKIIFFVIAVVNGSVQGGMLARKRVAILQSFDQQGAASDSEIRLRNVDRQFTWYYVVQFLLLSIIIFLSVFGDGKHPGAF